FKKVWRHDRFESPAISLIICCPKSYSLYAAQRFLEPSPELPENESDKCGRSDESSASRLVACPSPGLSLRQNAVECSVWPIPHLNPPAFPKRLNQWH